MTNSEPDSRVPKTGGVSVATPEVPERDAVLMLLERILASAAFAGSPRLQRFLRYVVERTLDGRARELRAYAIAVDVFDRSSDFDPQADSLVRVEAARLRQKLATYAAEAGGGDALRITLPKGGYVPVFEAVAATAGRTSPPDRRTGQRRRQVAVLGIALVTAAAIGGVVLARFWPLLVAGPPTAVEAANPERLAPALGVLPFAALDADPATSAATRTVAGALTALVTTDLVRFRQLFVLAERSAAALAAGGGDPIRAAGEAGLDFVVDGTVRRAPGGIAVTVSLIRTTDGQALWSESFAGPASDRAALDLEGEIAGAIVTALAQPYGILSQQLARAADRATLPESLQSYGCILTADRYYASYAPDDYAAARTCLEEALVREPGYAHGHAYMAYLLLDELRYGHAESPLGRELAEAAEAARRAVALESENAVAQRALAAVLFTAGDLEGFRRHAERALTLNPNDSDALADLGGKLAYAGEWERGLAMRERAMALNPAHPPAYHFPFVVDAFRRGDDTAALALLEQIGLPDFLMTRLLRTATLGRHGPPEAAAEAAAELLELAPDAAEMARDYFGYWHMAPELVDALVEGLGRAGLSVS